MTRTGDSDKPEWEILAQLAASEQDPKKLLELVTELNKLLEERERRFRGKVSVEPLH